MNKLKFTIISVLLGFIPTILLFNKSKSEHASDNSEKISISSCIDQDATKQQLSIGAFEVDLVENSSNFCVNPLFPSIRINTKSIHNGWIHIVYTDSSEPYLQTFIDSTETIYPFYTYDQTFYDAPLWSYSFINKPLSFWKGNVFAVQIDYDAKIINCVGGLEWGFKLPYFALKPQSLELKILDINDWNSAWELLKLKLPEYKQKYYDE